MVQPSTMATENKGDGRSGAKSRNSFSRWLYELHIRHERLKRFVHEGMRYPLPRWGQYAMGGVYFTIPVIAGYYLMQWNMKMAEAKFGLNGEKMPKGHINQGDHNMETAAVFGNTRLVDGQEQRVGAGGWGGGVRLAISDPETQERNQKKIRKYLRKLKREADERRRQQQQQQEPQTAYAEKKQDEP